MSRGNRCFDRQRQGNRIGGQAGFTLMELMVALAVIFILVAIAAPSMSGYLTRHRIGGTALDVLAAMREARLAAVEKNKSVVFRVDTANNVYEVFVDDGAGSADADANGLPDNAGNYLFDAGELMIGSAVLPRGVTFAGVDFSGNSSFHFNNRGFPLDPGNVLTSGAIDLVDNKGTTRRISLISSGHSRIE